MKYLLNLEVEIKGGKIVSACLAGSNNNSTKTSFVKSNVDIKHGAMTAVINKTTLKISSEASNALGLKYDDKISLMASEEPEGLRVFFSHSANFSSLQKSYKFTKSNSFRVNPEFMDSILAKGFSIGDNVFLHLTKFKGLPVLELSKTPQETPKQSTATSTTEATDAVKKRNEDFIFEGTSPSPGLMGMSDDIIFG